MKYNLSKYGYLRYLPETLTKEVASNAAGLVPAARGTVRTINALLDLPSLYLAYNLGTAKGLYEGAKSAVQGSGGVSSRLRRGLYTGLLTGAGTASSVRKAHDVPDIPMPKYLEDYFPGVLDNSKYLTDKQKATRAGLRGIAEDASQDLMTLGAGKLLRPLRALSQVSRYDIAANPAQWAVSYLMDTTDEKNRQKAKTEPIPVASSKDPDYAAIPKNPEDIPWYHHAAVGYGAGGLTGGATGYLLSTLMGGDKATRVISTVGGGALGAVLGRILQQKALKT